MTRRAAVWALAGLSVAAASGACAEVKPASSTHYKPAALSSVTGQPGVKQVTLTEEAARRIGLTTVAVRADQGVLVVPSEAVIYDAQGRSLVYTATGPLTFVRADAVVTTSRAKESWLSSGPAVGTPVVTTGASEVYGAEFEVGH